MLAQRSNLREWSAFGSYCPITMAVTCLNFEHFFSRMVKSNWLVEYEATNLGWSRSGFSVFSSSKTNEGTIWYSTNSYCVIFLRFFTKRCNPMDEQQWCKWPRTFFCLTEKWNSHVIRVISAVQVLPTNFTITITLRLDVWDTVWHQPDTEPARNNNVRAFVCLGVTSKE